MSSQTSYQLAELAQVIRSKNAKPYRMTLDILFNDRSVYEKVKASGALTEEVVQRLYGDEVELLSSFEFDAGLAFKFTFRRLLPQGSIGDSDMYGCQQYVPLLAIEVPWDEHWPAPPVQRQPIDSFSVSGT